MEKSIIIVGAGMAGLSAGCYARMNGYKTTIFEMHNIPGGLCTAWKRKDYKFDISMHMLTGSVSGPFNQMWRELGVIKNFRFHYHDHFLKVEGMGKSLIFCNDRKKLEDQMLAISKDDEALIKEFTALIFGRNMMNAASVKPAEAKSFFDTIKLIPLAIPLIRTFMRYRNRSIQEFAERFKDPFLKNAVRFFIDGPGWSMPDYPMITLTGFVQAGMSEAGVPLGGSQQVAFNIAELYRRLGGEMRLKSEVKDLKIKDNKTTGVVLGDGSEYSADIIIWAADGHTLIFDILKGKYLDEKIRNMYENWIPVKPILHVMMGVNRDFSNEAHKITFELEKPEIIAGREIRWMSFLHHSFDPSMAPAGKSAVEVWFDTEFEYWENLYADRAGYDAEKDRIAGVVISHLERKFPGFSSQVEVIDVPTPVTYRRYTGNWKGSPDGWAITNSNLSSMEPTRSLPGLDGLFMAGQWTAPYTGTVIAALSGRQLIELLCRREGKKFVTE